MSSIPRVPWTYAYSCDSAHLRPRRGSVSADQRESGCASGTIAQALLLQAAMRSRRAGMLCAESEGPDGEPGVTVGEGPPSAEMVAEPSGAVNGHTNGRHTGALGHTRQEFARQVGQDARRLAGLSRKKSVRSAALRFCPPLQRSRAGWTTTAVCSCPAGTRLQVLSGS